MIEGSNRDFIICFILGLIVIGLGFFAVNHSNKKDDCDNLSPITNSEKCVNTTDRVCEENIKC